MLSITPKLRARLIKFRYGPSRDQQTSSATTASASTAGSYQPQPGEPLWDFQIPPRWKRRPLNEEEIAVINNGGPL